MLVKLAALLLRAHEPACAAGVGHAAVERLCIPLGDEHGPVRFAFPHRESGGIGGPFAIPIHADDIDMGAAGVEDFGTGQGAAGLFAVEARAEDEMVRIILADRFGHGAEVTLDDEREEVALVLLGDVALMPLLEPFPGENAARALFGSAMKFFKALRVKGSSLSVK